MKKIILIVCLFLISGCQTAMTLPDVKEVTEITRVPTESNQSPIDFSGITFDIKRGERYLVYPYWRWSVPNVNVGFYTANYGMKRRLKNSERFWDQGEAPFANASSGWDKDVADYVQAPLKELGYDIVLPKKTMFNSYAERSRAELSLGATIVDVKMNVVHFYDMLRGKDQNMMGGEAYIKVKWEVYDPLRKKVMAQIFTQGRAQLDEGTNSGYNILLLRALENAAHNLGRSESFYKLMTNREASYPYPSEKKQSYLEIETDKKLYTQGIQKDYNFIRRSVVVVRSSMGHGSGFYINEEGYALTNAHVVDDAQTVAVIDFSGTQYMADVIRVDKRRDIALIKADVMRNPSIPLQLKRQPQMLDKVYAMGAPFGESLKGTVTEGIVSNFRKSPKNGLSYIQASIEIAPGCSGGPLTDEFGNVIGVTVEGTGEQATQYSRFIPINDALEALNIHIVKPTF